MIFRAIPTVHEGLEIELQKKPQCKQFTTNDNKQTKTNKTTSFLDSFLHEKTNDSPKHPDRRTSTDSDFNLKKNSTPHGHVKNDDFSLNIQIGIDVGPRL